MKTVGSYRLHKPDTPYTFRMEKMTKFNTRKMRKHLATGESLTADPGVASSIQARSHTLVDVDHEIISKVILPSAESLKKGCCQLQEKLCAQSTG